MKLVAIMLQLSRHNTHIAYFPGVITGSYSQLLSRLEHSQTVTDRWTDRQCTILCSILLPITYNINRVTLRLTTAHINRTH